MKYKQQELPHGGKLYYIKNAYNNSTMVDVVFDSGARYDTIPGIAHFTEHMFFTGTNKLSKEEITKKYFDFIGVNAFTRIEDITFTGQLFTNEFEDYLKTVQLMITESTFSKENVDKEIPIVQQEIARRKDKHDIISDYLNDYNLNGLNEFKDTILGSQKSVASIKSEDVKSFVNKFFVANNLDVFVASPISFNKVKRLVINNLSNKLPIIENFKKDPYCYYNVKSCNFYKIEHQDIGKNYLYINFSLNKNRWDFNFKYKFGLVLDMINDTSRGMMKSLRLDKSLTYGAYIYPRYLEENGYLCFRTECDKQNVNEIIKTLAEYLQNVYKNGFTDEQLNQAKRQYEYSQMTKEEYLRRDFFKLYNLKYYNKIIDIKEKLKIIKETTLDECNNLFKEVFKNASVSMTLYGNATKEDVVTKAEFKKLFNISK